MQKFAHFLKNCWTVLRIKFFKLPHLYNAIIDNVLGVHFLSGHSVYTGGGGAEGQALNMRHGHFASDASRLCWQSVMEHSVYDPQVK